MDTLKLVNRVVNEVKASLPSGVGSASSTPVTGGTLVVYTRSVAGLEKLCSRLVTQGGPVSLLLPKYGRYGVDAQRLKEQGVQVLTLGDSGGAPQWPSGLSTFSRMLFPGLHEVAVRNVGGIVDVALARAREQGVPVIALHEAGFGQVPNWLPAGVQWLPLHSFADAKGSDPSPEELAGMIDHTLLRADASQADIEKLCQEAAQWKFASVCVNPAWVALAAKNLKGTGVMTCTVIGFPLGATDSETKAEETRHALLNGADEIDMVLNVGALKSKNYDVVARDIVAVVKAAAGKTVKVILETGHLNDEEKTVACLLSKEAGAHFVKTSTGFGPGGATASDIALMRHLVGPVIGVKASGGIRDTATALKMVAAGANRIGASASVSIVKGTTGGGVGSGY